MSRVGKTPIPLPAGVQAGISGHTITVKGKSGELKYTYHPSMNVAIGDNVVTVTRPSDGKRHKQLHGLTQALIQNMVKGIEKGFREELDIIGVGWNAKAKGSKALTLQIGFCHTVEVEIPDGIKVELPTPQKAIITGIDKQLVGQFAANMRKIRPPEPYKGKGIRYTDEHVIRKVGKSQVGK